MAYAISLIAVLFGVAVIREITSSDCIDARDLPAAIFIAFIYASITAILLVIVWTILHRLGL